MLPADHQAAVQRALALGRSGDPAAMPELVAMLRLPSNEVQRLAVSAIGKLVEFGADAEAAVAALAPLALKARHPQTQQYAIRALKKCGAAAKGCVRDLRDLARNPAQRDYVRAAAATVADAIEQAAADAMAGVKHRCIIGEFQIRPDFYLPELDVYVEYWGMDTPQYKMSMYKKQTLYQQEGKRLISIYPADLPRLGVLLAAKLRKFGFEAEE
jgi:hypothetical protein